MLDNGMKRDLTGAELGLWPLVHGSHNLGDFLDDIRTRGLQPGSDTNSYAYDQALGRTKFVFLQPGRSGRGYGLGNLVVVDPEVLALPGVKGSVRDIGEVVRQSEWLLDSPERELPGWIRDPDRLRALVEEQRLKAIQAADSMGVAQIIRDVWVSQKALELLVAAAAFLDYTQAYFLPPTDFLDELARVYRDKGNSVDEFIDRDNLTTTEELLVPGGIQPRWLLGCRLDGAWQPWKVPERREVATRLEELVRRWNPVSS
jgi:hypothetical protein